MKTLGIAAITLALLPLGARADAPLTGDYVEARTASVFAGPCHYGGEYVSDGREAVAAWKFGAGDVGGVSVKGLSALAVIRADKNLAEPTAARTRTLFVDSRATPAQQAALVKVLAARLGTFAAVKSAPITFTRAENGSFAVNAPGVASLSVEAMPDAACCKQPSLVWYQPLVSVINRRVGHTLSASCTAKTGGDAWARADENSAFYGRFSL